MTKEEELKHLSICVSYLQYLSNCGQKNITPIKFEFWLTINGFNTNKD